MSSSSLSSSSFVACVVFSADVSSALMVSAFSWVSAFSARFGRDISAEPVSIADDSSLAGSFPSSELIISGSGEDFGTSSIISILSSSDLNEIIEKENFMKNGK